MSDLVERLRGLSRPGSPAWEAADRIEELERHDAELQRVIDLQSADKRRLWDRIEEVERALLEQPETVYHAIMQFQDIIGWQEGESRNVLVRQIAEKARAVLEKGRAAEDEAPLV
jgi:hypothetical protein